MVLLLQTKHKNDNLHLQHLHSNMVLLLQPIYYFFNYRNKIYIPIWCYYYDRYDLKKYIKDLFTFQYGVTITIFIITYMSSVKLIYIPIWCYYYSCCIIVYFSFFYIYIPIWCYYYKWDYLKNILIIGYLHSNMVLLLRVYKQLLISLVLIPVFCLSFEFYNIYNIYSNINYFKLPLINDYNYNCLTYCILAL